MENRRMRRLAASLLLAATPALAQNSSDTSTNSGTGSTIIYIVIGIIVVLFVIVAFFVWKRKQNRKRENDTDYALPSTSRHEGVAAHHQRPMTAYDGRAMTPGYDNAHPTDHRKAHEQQRQQRQERPPQWPVNGAPTYTRQQQQQQQHQQQQYQPRYVEQQMFPPPQYMMEQQQELSRPAAAPARSPFELQQAAAARPVSPSIAAAGEMPAARKPTAEMLARSREVAERVMASFRTDPDLEQRWIPYSSLYFTRVLSKGAFGEVWLAQLENTQVAVKRILAEKKHDEKEIECFGAEIKLMALFQHPKIVGFIGVSWSAEQDMCAVTEFMAKGDLYGYLKRRQGKLNWPDHKVVLAEDIADALVYLHSLSPKVIHRDLKSKNILLDDAYRAKLSDFGISRKRSVEETMTAGVGTIYWTAPEVLMGKKYTEKADIFSFGIVMSEMDTCIVPYSDKRDDSGKKLQGMKIVQLVIRKALRPSFAANCPAPIKALADRCLDANPDVRPDAPELLRILRRIQADLP